MSFETIFDEATLKQLRKVRAAPKGKVAYRISALTASPPASQMDQFEAYDHKKLVARRDAWREYVDAAERVGLVDVDLRERLRSPNVDQFYAAMGECYAAWFFSERLGCELRPRPPGHKGPLEFSAKRDGVECDVEVKASAVDPPGQQWSGDDAEVLMADIRDATDQLRKDRCNIVVLVPHLRRSVHDDRNQFLRAVVGQPAWQVVVRTDTGEPGGSGPTFKFDGLMTRGAGGKNADGSPRQAHTRIGAVLCLEERVHHSKTCEVDLEETARDTKAMAKALYDLTMAKYADDNVVSVDRCPIVVHNPAAEKPIAESFFGADVPQFVRRGDVLLWSDGAEL
jgi:hypothetical protein